MIDVSAVLRDPVIDGDKSGEGEFVSVMLFWHLRESGLPNVTTECGQM